MTIQEFLEEEKKKFWDKLDYDPLVNHLISERDTRLINFILDKANEVVAKKSVYDHDYGLEIVFTKDISTTINQLRVK